MEPTGGDVANHDQEYDEVEWMPLPRAIGCATYDNERRILGEAARILGVRL
jgi:hypothetical protein